MFPKDYLPSHPFFEEDIITNIPNICDKTVCKEIGAANITNAY